jgi:hypothetical protein
MDSSLARCGHVWSEIGHAVWPSVKLGQSASSSWPPDVADFCLGATAERLSKEHSAARAGEACICITLKSRSSQS